MDWEGRVLPGQNAGLRIDRLILGKGHLILMCIIWYYLRLDRGDPSLVEGCPCLLLRNGLENSVESCLSR